MSAPSDITFYHHAFHNHIHDKPRASAAPQRPSASQRKLAGFSESHLIELSADMYDELQRRQFPDRFPPGPLAPRSDIHWKRNDARKHVSSLPTQKFNDICRDLVDEQERRYPELRSLPAPSTEPEQNPVGVSARASPAPPGRPHISIHSADSAQSDPYVFPMSASPRENRSEDDSFDFDRSQSPSLHIQSVAESKVEPQKTQIVESDDDSTSTGLDSDSDSEEYTSVYGSEGHDSQHRRQSMLAGQQSRRSPDVEPVGLGLGLVSPKSSSETIVPSQKQPLPAARSASAVSKPPARSSADPPPADQPPAEQPSPITPTSDSELGSARPRARAGELDALAARIEELEAENRRHRTHIDELQAAGAPADASRDLEQALAEQQTVTEQVRSEAARFLAEMRGLTQQHERQIDRADSLGAEAQHWRLRYTKIQAELEKLRRQRVADAIAQPATAHLPPEWLDAGAKISAEQYWHYIGAVTALVACVHSDRGKRTEALQLLHEVVLATRALTSDKKSVVARAANLLITVVRNFTVSKGLVPLIIVDSACSDLTMAVIEHVQQHKLRPAQAQGKQSAGASAQVSAAVNTEASTEASTGASAGASAEASAGTRAEVNSPETAPAAAAAKPAKPAATHKKGRSSVSFAEAPQSTAGPANKASTPQDDSRPPAATDSGSPLAGANPSPARAGRFRPAQGPQAPRDTSIEALQTYLEEQTSGTVDAIGALLAGIKNNVVAGELKPRVDEIKGLVAQTVGATNKAISETRNILLKERGALIVDNLKGCLERMDMLLDEELEAIRDDAKPNRHLKQRLAGVSFDMAKSTKELVKTVEEASLQDQLDGIDRQLS